MVHSYFGGISREGRAPKFDSNINIFSPAEVVLSGMGSPAVSDGDYVCVGDTVFGGVCPVYATVSGSVKLSEDKAVIVSDGNNKISDKLIAASKALEEYTHDEIALEAQRYAVYDSKQDALLGDMIARCMQGERVVVNCCEGYFDGFASASTALNDIDALIGGCTVLLYALDAAKAIVCCDKTAKKLVKALKEATKGRRDITVAVIETRYPIVDRTLIGAIYGKGVVPQKQIDLQKHFVVTASAVMQLYNSFVSGLPQTSKTFALCVKGAKPVTVNAPLGTKISDILTQYGVELTPQTAVVEGNPINGTEIGSDALVGVKTDMIRVLTKVQTYEADCISCGRCSLACPMGLDVKQLVKSGRLPHKTLCMMCGACEFICPSRIKITDKIKSLFAEQKEDKND